MYTFSRDVMKFGFATDRLFFFLLLSLFSVHLFTCLWLFSAQFILDGNPHANTRLNPYIDEDFSAKRQYLASFYFITIMSYGSVTAANDFERMFGILIMILGGFLMTYAISVLGQIVVSMD